MGPHLRFSRTRLSEGLTPSLVTSLDGSRRSRVLKLLRSLGRIFIAVAVVAGIALSALALAVRQPTFTQLPFPAYATEEPPFFGSAQMGSAVHANSLRTDGRRVRGMICLEMIGYFSGEQTWPSALFALLYPARTDFIAVGGGWQDRELTRHVKRAIDGAGGVRVVSFTGSRETSDASDHRNYWSHGWPAVIVTDTAFLRNPNYHTSGDTAATLDYDRMARVVDGIFSAIAARPAAM
jgi:hypothetical protein